ncbi:MAG: methyltransferase domain-containing protein, partial [candidate division WOR-3 bacterium]
MTSVTSSEWDTFWQGLTPDSEIQMWDFYGGRPWILKHTPRWGKVVEAGCGLGRYVFYLHRLGIDVDGFDFHEPTLRSLQQWARANAIEVSLTVGDVAQLPYQDRSLSGYLSFGVVEHFQEGPQAALQEAFRVLRPGGIAIITVPSLSFSQIYRKSRQYISTVIKRLLGRPVKPRRFFQYWYRRRQLSAFVQRAGLEVVLCGGADLFYSMFELGLKPSSNFLSQAMGRLEKSPISAIGAQALTVSIKKAEMMYCFLCGKPR